MHTLTSLSTSIYLSTFIFVSNRLFLVPSRRPDLNPGPLKWRLGRQTLYQLSYATSHVVSPLMCVGKRALIPAVWWGCKGRASHWDRIFLTIDATFSVHRSHCFSQDVRLKAPKLLVLIIFCRWYENVNFSVRMTQHLWYQLLWQLSQLSQSSCHQLVKRNLQSIQHQHQRWWSSWPGSVLPDLGICSQFGYFLCKIAPQNWLLASLQYMLLSL